MKNEVLNIYKPVGVSPLGMINLLRERDSSYVDVKITYAGRLDPMAEGVLVLLVGDSVHHLDEYITLNKEYMAEILFGFETDTYDILGVLQSAWGGDYATAQEKNDILFKKIKDKIEKIKGEISFPFPPYSSYKIKGKPLFTYARENKLDEVEIPIKTTKIHDAQVLDSHEFNNLELLKKITEKIKKVKGDFRQKETIEKWQECLMKDTNSKSLVVKVNFNVSSGTYIRSIAHALGQELGVGAILFGLTRTRIGKFEVKDSIRL